MGLNRKFGQNFGQSRISAEFGKNGRISAEAEMSGQILVEPYTTYISQLDNFAAAETELLVVVQHRVHVLDPDGIHRAVEHVPPLVFACRRRADTDQRRQDAVSPA